jgi:hypothetical protein
MKLCHAILDFQDECFVCCELENKHEGPHKALNFKWEGEETTKAHASDRLRGLNLFKMNLHAQNKNEHAKEKKDERN